jgi:two-component system phosphate regulon sensor histidine kinase PhoR
MNSAAAERNERRDTNDLLQKLLDSTPDSVIVLGPGWRITASNQTAIAAFSRNGKELAGLRLSEIVRDLGLHDSFRLALEEQEPSALRFVSLSRDKRRYDVHIEPLEISGERLAIGFFRDVTQLERLETARQEFLSNISHELRTPLTSIIAFVETLEDGAVDDRENNRRFLNVIRRNADRMKVLIDDILELSFIESGRVSIELANVDLATIIDEIFSALSSKAAEREVTLVNDVSTGVVVPADSSRLEQMLTNLIDNAIKFNSLGGRVNVSYEMSDSGHMITVTDTGEGIIGEHLERIFERFYRTDRARSRDIGGTGLGLAIVKHLTRLHGGEVSVTSELTKGTCFRIELPRR